MKRTMERVACWMLGTLAGAAAMAGAAVLEVARPFGSGMVLPMGRPVPVWGKAGAGEEVRVAFAGGEKVAKANGDGEWRVLLPPFEACAEGRSLTFRSSGGGRLALDDVLVGRVFLCSGQSNMDFPLARATGGRAEAAAAAKWSGIRLMNLTGVPTADRVYDEATLARLNARDHFQGRWERSSPESAGAISAVAWWAGLAVHRATGVPVGLVENAVGGSGAEAWLPVDTLEAGRDYAEWAGPGWLSSEKIGSWARGRARRNLGSHPGLDHPFRPAFLHESGVRWWRDFPFDSVIWYQGETNAEVEDDPWNERLITDLVDGWRKSAGLPDLRFVMVQLPRIGGNDPLRKGWPRFREVQARAAKKRQGVSLVVTMDLGWDSPDVHPPDKKPVAERVAAAILDQTRH